MCRKQQILSAPDRSSPSRSLEFFAIKLFAPWRSLTPVDPRSFRSLMSSDLDDSPYGKQRSTAIRTNRLSYLERIFTCTKNAPVSATIAASKRAHPTRNACRPPRNGQLRTRPLQPPRSKTRVCLSFVCITLLQ